jgi:cell division protein ZapA (FtsZ GTPase activity inhibitor)
MEKSIRVRILGRDYPLLVREGEETLTREMAGHIDARMKAFKKAHPEQSDLVAAVMTSLALAEDLLTASEQERALLHALDDDLAALDRQLAQALPTDHP